MKIQRQTVPDDEDKLLMKPLLQFKLGQGSMAAPPELESSIQHLRGSGQPLADMIREPMEQAFGADFSGVKVHTDAQSDQLNQSIQAKAFTTGQDIFFRQGAYEPSSRSGQELIAHELTHVVQQNGTALPRLPQTHVQRQIMNNGKKVSKEEFQSQISKYGYKDPEKYDPKKADPAKARYNPYGLGTNQELINYIYNYYTHVHTKDVDLLTATRKYWQAMTAAKIQQNVQESAADFLRKEYKKQRNEELGQELLREAKTKINQNDETMIIFRGTQPVQATQIPINKSMGGAPAAGTDLNSPGEEAAKKQTGENVKETEQGRVEEWSRKPGGLTGFATGGVMLVARVRTSSVAWTSIEIGEMGVTGYAQQPLRDVAIYSYGGKSVASLKNLFFDEAKKAFNLGEGVQDKTQAKTSMQTEKKLPPGGGKPTDKFFT